jgi:hypothetical protein
MVGAILGNPDPQVADEPLHVEGEEARGEGEDEEEDEIPCGHQLALRAVDGAPTGARERKLPGCRDANKNARGAHRASRSCQRAAPR